MRRELVWFNLNSCEAVQHKLKNSLKTPKMHFLPVFYFMSHNHVIWATTVLLVLTRVEATFEKIIDKSKAEELSYLILVWLPWSSKPASLRAFLHLDTKWEEKETMVVRPKYCRFAVHNGSISFLRGIHIFLQLTISQFSNHRSMKN